MGLTPRRIAFALLIAGIGAIAVALSLLLAPAVGLLALGISAVALALEELLR